MRVEKNVLNRKTYTLKDFRGVDYSSSPLEVKPYRATDMANLLLKDGVLHKRNGWEQVGRHKRYYPTSYNVPETILEVVPYKGSKLFIRTRGERSENPAHPYHFVHVYDMETGETNTIWVGTSNLTLPSEGSSILAHKNYVYFFMGELFRVYTETTTDKVTGKPKEEIKVETIDDRVAYHPMTTINILPYGTTLDATIYQRTKKESLNLLTGFRVNRLIVDNTISPVCYKLDGKQYERSEEDALSVAEVRAWLQEKYPNDTINDPHVESYAYQRFAEKRYTAGFLWKYLRPELKVKNAMGEVVYTITFSPYNMISPKTNRYIWVADQSPDLGNITNGNIWLGTGNSLMQVSLHGVNHPYAGDDFSVLEFSSQIKLDCTHTFEITFFEDTYNTIKKHGWDLREEGVNYGYDGIVFSANAASQFRNAIRFGYAGATDRVFCSRGGTWATEKDDLAPNVVCYSENDDFTYFPANQQLVCGSPTSGVVSFERISDGTLAVFKEYENGQDVGVYYITGRSVSMGTGEEGNEYFAEIFSVHAGNINEDGIAARGAKMLEGDSLFVSKSGVYALVLSENVASSERYARLRSRAINNRLVKYDLSAADAAVFDKKYYLAVGGEEGEVYVADARYKYNLEGDLSGEYNYEWFRLVNVPATCWFLYENTLWFADKDGWLCKFTDGYMDVYSVGESGYTVDGEYILSGNGDLSAKILDSSGNFLIYDGLTEGRVFVFFNETLRSLIEKSVYVTDIYGTRWNISEIEEREFVDSDSGETVSLPCFELLGEGRLSFNTSGGIGLKFHVPVKAYWKSGITDLGSALYRKSFIPTKKGSVMVGYRTRRENKIDVFDGPLDFGEIDFSHFTFDCSDYASAYRQRVFERGFVYMQMLFESETEGDIMLSELTVEYSVTTKNIGIG